ncbi:uncharacterized protein ACBR49_007780 [Aulostomus maculatus]
MMEMSVKQSMLVFLTVAFAVMVRSHHYTVIMDETQEKVVIPFGSSFTLCYRLKIEAPERVKTIWYFSSSGARFDKIVDQTALFLKTQMDKEIWLNHTLFNVTLNNTGWYYNKIIVEIPFYKSMESNRMEVLVMPVFLTDVSPLNNWWLWLTLGVVSFVLIIIVMLVICLFLSRRQRRRRESECPIYTNTRSVASKQQQRRSTPGTPMAKLKMVHSS